MFTPGPHIVITDAAFTDPEARAGTDLVRLQLTAAGRQVLADARRLLAQAEELQTTARSLGGDATGRLVVVFRSSKGSATPPGRSQSRRQICDRRR